MPTPQQFSGKYVDDFKEALEMGRLKKEYTPGIPLTGRNFIRTGFETIDQGLNTMQQGINNPLLNMATGQPLTFEDESGTVSIAPGGIFQAQQREPGGWGGAIDVPNRSVSLNKGMFDVSAGMGPTYMPNSTVRVGFDTRRMNSPQMILEETESPLMQREPSAGELERDQVIDQYKASNPFWYRPGVDAR